MKNTQTKMKTFHLMTYTKNKMKINIFILTQKQEALGTHKKDI